jgi:uncharacterized protein DUF1844
MPEERTPHKNESDHEASAINFVAFVMSLAHTAAVHFGDVPDPVSGTRVEANLPAGQQMIDILALMEQKTRGNLTAEERQLLEQVLFELRLRFVELQNASGPAASEPKSRIILP